jgi:hypothetical protein
LSPLTVPAPHAGPSRFAGVLPEEMPLRRREIRAHMRERTRAGPLGIAGGDGLIQIPVFGEQLGPFLVAPGQPAKHGQVRGRDFRPRLTVVAERTLRIEIADARTDRLPVAAEDSELALSNAESGRGMLLVGALADAWGCDTSDAHTKTVWAEIPLP